MNTESNNRVAETQANAAQAQKNVNLAVEELRNAAKKNADFFFLKPFKMAVANARRDKTKADALARRAYQMNNANKVNAERKS